jgi:hypothetical protein
MKKISCGVMFVIKTLILQIKIILLIMLHLISKVVNKEKLNNWDKSHQQQHITTYLQNAIASEQKNQYFQT